jgi:hypothetical protein
MLLTPRMTSVEALPDEYKLIICFETGEKKLYDVRPHIWGAWYNALADKEYFRAVRLLPNGSDIAWPDGQDIAPHMLYENSTDLPSIVSGENV